MNVRHGLMLLVCASGVALGGCEAEVSTVGEVHTELPTAETGAGDNRALGEACLPGDEWHPEFSGFGRTETNIDDVAPGSPPSAHMCASALCLVNHFSGRTTCPYGQAAPTDEQEPGAPVCALPDGLARVAVAVPPQLVERPPEDTVYCSCRCAGPEGTGPFCACPQDMECVELVPDTGPGGAQYTGSYCIKQGTAYDPNAPGTACDWRLQNCEPG